MTPISLLPPGEAAMHRLRTICLQCRHAQLVRQVGGLPAWEPHWREWYDAVLAVLERRPDGASVQLPMIWTTGFPSRFAWVDGRLRVWCCTEEDGVVRNVASLKGNQQ